MNTINKLRVIHVRVPLTPAYNNRYLQLRETVIDLDLALTNGEHRITTDPIEVGTSMFGGTIVARLRFWYHYDERTNHVTLCSDDLLDDDAMCLITTANGNENCYQYPHAGVVHANHNPSWNTNTPLTPGLEEALRRTVRKANNHLIAKAGDLQVNLTVRSPFPELEADDYAQLSSVYHRGEFLEFFDPNKEYGPEHTILTVDSTGYGKTTLNVNADFANVIGSTKDPKLTKTWVGLWELVYGNAPYCASQGYPNTVVCGGVTVGGHTILGMTAQKMATGSNSVMIIPICHTHNMKNKTYMQAIHTQKAVSLKGYFQG